MIRVAIIAHFLSENLGDRYQGTGLADRLMTALPGVVIDRVNSHPFDRDIEVETVLGSMPLRFDVLNPELVDYSSYDFSIMPTGSIASDSFCVQWGLKLLESSRLKRMFVWGGFHDITDFCDIHDPSGHLKTFFSDPRTYFYARGWLELAVYHMLAGGGRGSCGGDPVLLNDFSAFRGFAPSSEMEATLVVNGHSFGSQDVRIRLSEVASVFPRICYIEGVKDKEIIKAIGKERCLFANTISEYAAIARSSSIIVSQRLHGLAFAKAVSPGLPVILWIPKQERFSNIKFRSVGESAAGFGMGIAHLRDDFTVEDARWVMKNPDSYLRREHEINFARYVDLTERTLHTIIAQIAQYDKV